MAEDFRDPTSQKTLMKLASDYTRMADHLERLGEPIDPLNKPTSSS